MGGQGVERPLGEPSREEWGCGLGDSIWPMDFVLIEGQTLLARISNITSDQPWFEADFDPTPAFEKVRPLFERARALLSDWPK